MDDAIAAAVRLAGGEVIGVQAPLDGDDGGNASADVGAFHVGMLAQGALLRVSVNGETGKACLAKPINDDEEEDTEDEEDDALACT